MRVREGAGYTYLMYSSAGWAAPNHCIAPMVAPSPSTYAASEVAKNGLSNTGSRPSGRCAFRDANGERDLSTRTTRWVRGAAIRRRGGRKGGGKHCGRVGGRDAPVIPQAQAAPEPRHDDIPPAEEGEPARGVQEEILGFREEDLDRCVEGGRDCYHLRRSNKGSVLRTLERP